MRYSKPCLAPVFHNRHEEQQKRDTVERRDRQKTSPSPTACGAGPGTDPARRGRTPGRPAASAADRPRGWAEAARRRRRSWGRAKGWGTRTRRTG
ncbi:hypothetical protein VTK73DRAFT_6329 [Phialemonium thermophilum]|uniref:Uncharacterized protein n=1 Tax=Phialemonium thermophilum TaxID=223376 RepID=A0ABR3UZM2_9PEZI